MRASHQSSEVSQHLMTSDLLHAHTRSLHRSAGSRHVLGTPRSPFASTCNSQIRRRTNGQPTHAISVSHRLPVPDSRMSRHSRLRYRTRSCTSTSGPTRYVPALSALVYYATLEATRSRTDADLPVLVSITYVLIFESTGSSAATLHSL